jgi:predicted phage tail protein
MALSDREQRLLDEMERNLYHSEADVLSTSNGNAGRPKYRAIVIGVVIAVVGLSVLMAGVMVKVLLVGVIGFAAMLGGVLFIFSPKQQRSEKESSSAQSPSGKARSSQSFSQRMEQRWQERGEGTR